MPAVWKIRSDGVKQRFNLSPLRGEIVKLYQDGLSSRKIGNKLNLSHVRILKILKLENLTRRKLIQSISNPNYKDLTPQRAYIFGVMCGDGCVFSGLEHKKRWSFKSHIVHLSVKDKDFLDEFVKNFEDVYGSSPKIYYRDRKNKKWSNIWIARVNRKLIYEDLAFYNFSTMCWRVPDEIKSSSDKRVIGSFLRGIYDSEGSVTIGSRGATLSFYSVNMEGIQDVKELLSKLEIETSKIMEDKRLFGKNKCYFIYITHTKNYLLFIKYVGFYIKRKEDKLIRYIQGLRKTNHIPLDLKTKFLTLFNE